MMMRPLTSDNYHSLEANSAYWSVSQYKAFDRCEAAGLAMVEGAYEREETTALLVGSYVDAYFTGDIDKFRENHPQIFNSRTGELKADYRHAETMIEAVKRQPKAMEFLKGEHQLIRVGNLFDVEWKIKIDVHGGNRLVDLKTVRDFNDIYEDGFGRRPWVEYWGYDVQAAVYQRIEQAASGRTEPLPFYIVAVTKEKIPDVKVIHFNQHYLDSVLKIVEAKIDRFDLVKQGILGAERCGKCDYCKKTKLITTPEEFGVMDME